MSAQFRRTICIAFLLLALTLSGCLGSTKKTATQPPNAAYTEAAQTIVAELTFNAPTVVQFTVQAAPPMASATPTIEKLPPTSTPKPTKTPLPSDTPEPTDTPLPSSTPTNTNTPTLSSSPEPNFTLAYKDGAFTMGWPTGNDSDVYYHFTRGGYAIVNRVQYDVVYSTRGAPYVDTRVEVTGSRVSGPLDGYYGVICRFADGRNYYFFAAGSDGWYGIGKKNDGVMTFLKEKIDTSKVHTGNVPNLIRGDCVGNTLTLYVNGVKLVMVEDNDFSGGTTGLAVGTHKDTPYEAFFDDFAVYTLK
jgi:hypothetical protein